MTTKTTISLTARQSRLTRDQERIISERDAIDVYCERRREEKKKSRKTYSLFTTAQRRRKGEKKTPNITVNRINAVHSNQRQDTAIKGSSSAVYPSFEKDSSSTLFVSSEIRRQLLHNAIKKKRENKSK